MVLYTKVSCLSVLLNRGNLPRLMGKVIRFSSTFSKISANMTAVYYLLVNVTLTSRNPQSRFYPVCICGSEETPKGQ